MRFSWAAGAAAALVLSAAMPGNAGATPMQDDDNISIGVGIICNTSEQMQRLIGLRMTGQEVPRAVSTVNDEVKDPRACGVAAVAFMSDKMVDLKNVNGKMVQIVRITVLAAFDGQQWSRIPVMTQYALIEPQGHSI